MPCGLSLCTGQPVSSQKPTEHLRAYTCCKQDTLCTGNAAALVAAQDYLYDVTKPQVKQLMAVWMEMPINYWCCRDDVLPCRVYLRHCVLAAQKLGKVAHDSFFDHTYLADRTTTVRQHLHMNPAIMAEKPPDSLSNRYSG